MPITRSDLYDLPPRERCLTQLALAADVRPDTLAFTGFTRTLSDHLMLLSDQQVSMLFGTSSRLTRRLAGLAGHCDADTFLRLLSQQEIHAVEDLDEAQRDSFVRDARSSGGDLGLQDGPDLATFPGVMQDQSLGHPGDGSFQGEECFRVAGAQGVWRLRLLRLLARLLHIQFSIGLQHADGEAPRRDSQERGGVVSLSAPATEAA